MRSLKLKCSNRKSSDSEKCCYCSILLHTMGHVLLPQYLFLSIDAPHALVTVLHIFVSPRAFPLTKHTHLGNREISMTLQSINFDIFKIAVQCSNYSVSAGIHRTRTSGNEKINYAFLVSTQILTKYLYILIPLICKVFFWW